jgi:hypothetical protein
MYQQLWGYKVEEKLYLGVREQKRLNTTALNYMWSLLPANDTFRLLRVRAKPRSRFPSAVVGNLNDCRNSHASL